MQLLIYYKHDSSEIAMSIFSQLLQLENGCVFS